MEEESDDEDIITINALGTKDKPKGYNVAKDMWFTQAMMNFGELLTIPKYRQQMAEVLEGTSINELTQEERPKYSIYVKLGRYQVLAELDSGAQITTISEPLAKKLELKWEPMDSKLTLIAANGGRNQALGVIKDANLRIKDVKVPINIYVRESSEESLLIGATWFKRYEADMMLSANRLLFVAQGRKFETKIYEGNPKDVFINTWTVEEEGTLPSPYKPTIIISDDEADNEEEDNWDPMIGSSV